MLKSFDFEHVDDYKLCEQSWPYKSYTRKIISTIGGGLLSGAFELDFIVVGNFGAFLASALMGEGTLHTRAKSHDHEIVRAQKKVS